MSRLLLLMSNITPIRPSLSIITKLLKIIFLDFFRGDLIKFNILILAILISLLQPTLSILRGILLLLEIL